MRAAWKLAITVWTALGLAWLIQVPQVNNALMLFVALGVNPLNNRHMSSASIYGLLGGLAALVVLLLFWGNLRRWYRRTRTATVAPKFEGRPAAQATPKTFVRIATPAITQPLKAHRARRRMPMPMPMPNVIAPMRWLVRTFVRAIQNTGKRCIAAVLTAWQWVRPRVIAYAQTMRVAAQFVWSKTEPRIRSFDAWLEHRLKQHEVIAAALEVGAHTEASLAKWRSEFRQLRQNTQRK